jgi:putative selenium metabolism hydrolase
VVGGAVHGRGSADMKSAVAAMIVAGARVRAAGRPAGTLVVSASVCEELFEGKGFAAVADAVRPDVVVIGEASELRLNRGGRGRAEVVVETAGVPAHSSTPHIGVNAVYQMMAALPRLRAVPLPTDPFLGPAMLELTDILSSPYPGASVLPVACRVTFDRRLLVGEDEDAVLGPLRAVLDQMLREDARFKGAASIAQGEVRCYTGATLGGTKFAHAWAFPAEHPMVRRARAGLAATGQDAALGHYRFCTNGSYSGGVAHIPTLGYGPGRENQAHVTDEALALDQITRACAGYAALIRALTTPD